VISRIAVLGHGASRLGEPVPVRRDGWSRAVNGSWDPARVRQFTIDLSPPRSRHDDARARPGPTHRGRDRSARLQSGSPRRADQLPVPYMALSWATDPARRRLMQANRSRDTAPELRVRSAVHARGLRYRVGVRPIPQLARTADLVFAAARVAVFVDGCFWHRCALHRPPARTNAAFWQSKLDQNAARDHETSQLLSQSGWHVLRFWEHDDPDEAAGAIEAVVRSRLAYNPEQAPAFRRGLRRAGR
jgi:DNA mismatch endonuclease Vsr